MLEFFTWWIVSFYFISYFFGLFSWEFSSILSIETNFTVKMLILLNFLCAYEIQWDSYLLSWKSVLLWECLYAVFICPVHMVGDLDLMRKQIMSFLSVCWQLRKKVRSSPEHRVLIARARYKPRLLLWAVVIMALPCLGGPSLLE